MTGRYGLDDSYRFTGFVSYPMDTTGNIALISTVPQGVTQSSRVGKKIWNATLEVKGTCVAGTTATIAEGTIWIVYDRRPTGVLPAVTDVLNTASSNSFRNEDNGGRFKILYWKDYLFIGNSTTPTVGKEAFDADVVIRVDEQTAYKNLATGAINDIEEGSLLLVTVGNVVGGTTAPNANLAFKLNFVNI